MGIHARILEVECRTCGWSGPEAHAMRDGEDGTSMHDVKDGTCPRCGDPVTMKRVLNVETGQEIPVARLFETACVVEHDDEFAPLIVESFEVKEIPEWGRLDPVFGDSEVVCWGEPMWMIIPIRICEVGMTFQDFVAECIDG